MKNKYLIIGIALIVCVAGFIYINVNTNNLQKNIELYGNYTSNIVLDESKGLAEITFVFDKNNQFAQYEKYYSEPSGTYQKVSDNQYLLIFNDGKVYQIYVYEDAFDFVFYTEEKTILSRFTNKTKIPTLVISESE